MNSHPTAAMRAPNRLIHEKSPYLLQHAYNPVQWYPWGEEAFTEARTFNRPIFLSIGYSTCHWCHVMEHESFESTTIAAIMNKHFVNIKVDREERPDVDRVYMTALQSMGQNGGWPMSMFLTPDLKPFYGGTYYPPESRYGRIGFPDLLHRIKEIWENERAKVLQSAEGLTEFLRKSAQPPGGDTLPGLDVTKTCFDQLGGSYDAQWGGFGGGPKFPRPSVFQFLLPCFVRTHEREALDMTISTLHAMAEGGVCDQIGGGFHRYAVDAQWRVPHFEKMLYDQAQLVNVFLDGYLLTGEARLADVARDTLRYVVRDLTDAGGGFYSGEDADSTRPDAPDEKGEGAFYIWTARELRDALGADAEVFCHHFGVEEEGNALVDPQLEFTGRNILYIARSVEDTAKRFGLDVRQCGETIEHCKELLLSIRAGRPRPHRDEKILTSWNGLMISAFARAGMVLDDSGYVMQAERAADFVLTTLMLKDGTLLRRYCNGDARFEGTLEDYAFLVEGLLDLYEATFGHRWLETACILTDTMLGLFQDAEQGGFFDTTGNDPSILVRTKEQYDGAEPCGNSVAVSNLLRLSSITGRASYREQAEAALRFFSPVLQRHPNIMPRMVVSVLSLHHPSQQVVVVGEKDDARTRELLCVIRRAYSPGRVVLLMEPSSPDRLHSDFIRSLVMMENKPTAYVCEDFVCKLPVTDPVSLEGLFREATESGS